MAEAGKSLSIEDAQEIIEAFERRHKNFPLETWDMTIMLVLLNIGDRYAEVVCINGEWTGIKKDIPKGIDLPRCPNGHILTQGSGLTLGWIKTD
jgi:hypothetical protein